jgi:hypothetical protein
MGAGVADAEDVGSSRSLALPAAAVESRFEPRVADDDGDRRASEVRSDIADAAQAAPKPEDTIAAYWQRYRADRRRSEGVEWLMTSIGAYAWAVLIIATGPRAPAAAVGAAFCASPSTDASGEAAPM